MATLVSLGPPASPEGRFSVRALLELVLLLTFAGCLGFVAYVAIDERAFQTDQRNRLEELVNRSLRGPNLRAESGRLTHPVAGEPVGFLEIPGARIQAMITAGDDDATLRRSVGWLPQTALPGEHGNAVLAGHRDTFFRGLQDLRADDAIWITTPRGRLQYRVVSTEIVDPTRLDVLAPTSMPTLTLITCYPFTHIGPAPRRYIVRARQVS